MGKYVCNNCKGVPSIGEFTKGEKKYFKELQKVVKEKMKVLDKWTTDYKEKMGNNFEIPQTSGGFKYGSKANSSLDNRCYLYWSPSLNGYPFVNCPVRKIIYHQPEDELLMCSTSSSKECAGDKGNYYKDKEYENLTKIPELQSWNKELKWDALDEYGKKTLENANSALDNAFDEIYEENENLESKLNALKQSRTKLETL